MVPQLLIGDGPPRDSSVERCDVEQMLFIAATVIWAERMNRVGGCHSPVLWGPNALLA